MANDPKINCRVWLESSVLNTNLPELKWNMLLNITFKGRFEWNSKMPAGGSWQSNTRQGKLLFSLVSEKLKFLGCDWRTITKKPSLHISPPYSIVTVCFFIMVFFYKMLNAGIKLQMKWKNHMHLSFRHPQSLNMNILTFLTFLSLWWWRLVVLPLWSRLKYRNNCLDSRWNAICGSKRMNSNNPLIRLFSITVGFMANCDFYLRFSAWCFIIMTNTLIWNLF